MLTTSKAAERMAAILESEGGFGPLEWAEAAVWGVVTGERSDALEGLCEAEGEEYGAALEALLRIARERSRV